jgi:NAD(P)-dependent dehydrogenase (short-subunit alcohol dehydrogenase family)
VSTAARWDLTGRVAVVTGGAQGLGAAIARALGEQGATVPLVLRRRAGLVRGAPPSASRQGRQHAFRERAPRLSESAAASKAANRKTDAPDAG